MPSVTITVSTEAHARLKKLKRGNESFTSVILREVHDGPSMSGAEILEALREIVKGSKHSPAKHATRVPVERKETAKR